MLTALLLTTTVVAQWLNYPTPGVPRLPDGKPDFSAPAPRTADGKPDLSGIWSGAGPSYRFNIAQDLETKDIHPWAEALFIQRVRDARMDSPLSKCLPVSVPYHNFFNLTRIVQTPALVVMLYESANVPPRTVFTDGRDLPKDPNPTWFGYSIGRWEGDTLVITSAGFNDQGWLDSSGHPQTESLRLTERLRRRDFGHMDYEITVDDPKVFTRPFTINASGCCRLIRSSSKTFVRTSAAAPACPAIPASGCARNKWRRSPASMRSLRGGVHDHGDRRSRIRARPERAEGPAARAVGDEVHVHDDADWARVLQGRTRHRHACRRARRGGSRTEGGPQERRRAGQMRRVIPVSAVLLTAAATLSAQTGAWLGQPMTAWNQPAGAVPASGIGISSQAALERRCGSASAGTAVSSDALRRASWVTYRHLDQSL